MSEEARKRDEAYLDSLWQRYLAMSLGDPEAPDLIRQIAEWEKLCRN